MGSFVFEIVLNSKNCGLRLDLGADLVSLQNRDAVSLSGKEIPFSAKLSFIKEIAPEMGRTIRIDYALRF